MSVDCEFITGIAGTGKTETVRRRIAADPNAGLLAATTGVAAVNLDTTTLNSLLGFFDSESFGDAFVAGRVTKKLVELSKHCSRIIVDEVSMMPAETLEILYQAVEAVNNYESIHQQLGITLVADFCQLPPIPQNRRDPTPWAFNAPCWPRFGANMTRLTKVWRQSDPVFLDALNAARRGDGRECGPLLVKAGVRFHAGAKLDFDGTTIMGTNRPVERFNGLALARLPGPETRLKSSRWGVLRNEWKHIPETLVLKEGAYVMALANSPVQDGGTFERVNGDCGHVVDYIEDESGALNAVVVNLVRTGEDVVVPYLTRHNETKVLPDGLDESDEELVQYDERKGRYIIGGLRFIPLRLAYAATTHKTQGLTLDRCQVDLREHFMGSPNLVYVALSRTRTPQGLRIVGSPELLARRAKIHEEVKPWL